MNTIIINKLSDCYITDLSEEGGFPNIQLAVICDKDTQIV